MSSPLFGIIPTGQPLITDPSSTPSSSSFLYSLPNSRPFTHITVFLLPNITLPPNTAAAIYVANAADVAAAAAAGQTPNFKFMGGVGPGKESVVFKISEGGSDLVLGISVEPAESVAGRIQEVTGGKVAGGTGGPNTVVLAQRIIKNAFNFLASFSGQVGPGGVEVVPLKAFEEWWRKFESRIRSDPSFLEKQID